MNKGNTIGIPFHAALASAITEAGVAKCAPCFKVLSRLAAATKLTDGHRAVFDAFTDAAGKLGFTGETQIVRQTAISLMSKDPALISKRFGIPADILVAYVPTKQFSYDQSIVAALKSLADTNGDKKAYEALAQLVGETKMMDEGCRTSVFNALYESAKKLDMIRHQVILTAASAIMWQNPTYVAQRFGADVTHVKDIIAGLRSKPISADGTKHASSSQQKPSSSPDKHRHTQVPPKSAPTQQAQPSARMTGGTRS